jgi:hypothetical protein
MEGGEHKHDFIPSDDGFEVCFKCGVCSSQRVYEYERNSLVDNSRKSEYTDILINNHIGYEEEIEELYNEIKFKLPRGYPNIALYAYSTYCILLKHSIFYTIMHIEQMFKIDNFKKSFCQIERNECIKKTNFDLNTEEYSLSAIQIFLSELGFIYLSGKAFKISKNIRKDVLHIRPQFLIAVSIYLALFDCFNDHQKVLENLSHHFSINLRTLKGVIRKYKIYKIS